MSQLNDGQLRGTQARERRHRQTYGDNEHWNKILHNGELFPCAARLFNHGIKVVQHRIACCIVALLEGANRIVPAVY